MEHRRIEVLCYRGLRRLAKEGYKGIVHLSRVVSAVKLVQTEPGDRGPGGVAWVPKNSEGALSEFRDGAVKAGFLVAPGSKEAESQV